MMIRLTLLYVFIMVSLCVLPPLNKPSVLINPSNQYELATYTFSFTLQMSIGLAATLEVQFPGQFQVSDLAQTNCTMSMRICSISYPLGINTSQEYDIILVNISNPIQGGVGNFQIRTKVGSNIIEQSRIFSNAGLRGAIDPFLYIELSSDNNIAGMNATYSLRFKTIQSYAYAVTFQMQLMNYYNITMIQQQYTSIDSTQQYSIVFGMQNPYMIDSLADLPATIYKGTYLLVEGNVKNPTFQAAPLQCTMTYNSWLSANNQYKVVDYDFTVLALYPPIVTSQLEIIVPEYFARYNTGVQNTLFYYGYDNNMLSFQGDRVFLMDIFNSTATLKYRLRLQNPYIVGSTSPFRLSLTYQGSVYMFDETTCVTSISSQAPADLTHPLTVISSNSVVGNATNLTFTIPAVSNVNQVMFHFSPEWAITPSAIAANISNTGYSVLSYTPIDNWTIQATLNQNISTTLSLTLSSINGIINPSTNGSYLVEVTMGNVSYTDIIVVNAIANTLTSLSVLGNTLTAVFTSKGIQNGEISIQFQSGTFMGTLVDCTLNNVLVVCEFLTNTLLVFENITLTNGTAYTVIVSGVSLPGTSTYTLQQSRVLPDVGSVEMRQTASKSATNAVSATINCGQSNISYGLMTNMTIQSCMSMQNVVGLLVVTDSSITTLQTQLLIDSISKQTSNPLYHQSIILNDTLPVTFTNFTLNQVLPIISSGSSVINIYLSNSTSTNLYTYTLNINQANSLPTVLSLSSYTRLDVGVVYNFTITPVADTAIGSLIIDFTSAYSLNGSAAWSTTNLNGYTAVSVESTRVIVNNVQLAANTQYLVSVFGVTNPDMSRVTGINVQFAQTTPSLIVFAQVSSTLNVSLTSALTKSAINITVNFYPQNALTVADYTFSLVTPRPLPAMSYLEINFPGQFATLGVPICSLQSVGYISCSPISNLTILIVLSNGIAAGVPLLVHIGNITNPFEGTTSPFYVSAACNSKTIADGNSNALLVQQSCKVSSLVNWSSLPTTMGEEAVYTFQYLPSYDITYQDTLFVRFPYEFDQRIGFGLTCTYTDSLQVEYEVICQNAGNFMQVQIYIGEYYVYTMNPITIKIIGVVNINIPSGVLTVGVKQISSAFYTEISTTLVGVTPSNAAATLTFNALTASNLDIRMTGTYQVEFYTSLPITCSTMSIFIVFPYYVYELTLNQTVACSSPQFQASCQIGYNNRIEVIPVGIQKIPAGLVSVTLLGVDNPVDESTVSSYYVEIYDQLNQIVVARTFSNLQFYSMQFVALGPYIKFNNEQDVIMNEGTTINLPIYITQPLILQVKSRGLGPFSFSPYQVILPVGTTNSSVNISSPKGQTGTFTITWLISGDLSPLYYTPVKQTTVYVQQVLTNVNINSIGNPLVVMAGGCSSMVQVILDYSPDTNIIVDIYDNATTPFTTIQFLSNQSVKYFSICNRTISGQLSFQLDGINQPNYQLITQTLNYTVTATIIPTLPTAIFNVNTILKTSAQFNLSMNSAVSTMIVVSLNNSLVPNQINQSTLSSQMLVLLPLTTQTQTIMLQYTTPLINQSVSVGNLAANQSYQATLYAFLTNGTYTYLSTVSFWTLPFDPVYQLTFTFSNNLSDIDKLSFIQSISYTLGIPISTLSMNPQFNSSTAVQIIIGQALNTLTDETPSPLVLSNNLYIRPTRLQSRVKSLILQNPYSSMLGPITTVPNITSLYLSAYNIDTLTFVVEASAAAKLYSVLVINNQTLGQPTTQQIYLSLGSLNLQPASQQILVSSQPGANTFVFSQLSSFQTYLFCVVVGNLDPTTTLNNTAQCLTGDTIYPPSYIRLTIKSGSRLYVYIWLSCLLVLSIIH